MHVRRPRWWIALPSARSDDRVRACRVGSTAAGAKNADEAAKISMKAILFLPVLAYKMPELSAKRPVNGPRRAGGGHWWRRQIPGRLYRFCACRIFTYTF